MRLEWRRAVGLRGPGGADGGWGEELGAGTERSGEKW